MVFTFFFVFGYFQILKGIPKINGRPGATMEPFDFDKLREELKEKFGPNVHEVDVMSAALYPQVLNDYLEFREKYGPVECLETKLFFVGPKMAQECEVSL